MNRLSLLLSSALVTLLACKPAAPVVDLPADTATEPIRDAAFIQREGPNLMLNNQPVLLQGIAFGNWVWDNTATPSLLHHNEQDYARLQSMGLNCVRFYLNYKYFEDDNAPYIYKQAGWNWLDQNVRWAKQHGIYLILNVHIPQGGYQSQGNGGALWDVPENQNRLVALWKAIAQRYQDEPSIAGYDLLNEPVVTRSIDQWQTLAQRLVGTIRTVDRRHLVVVERLNAVGTEWKDVNGERNLFLVKDDNVMYQFHMYDPFEFTHQTFAWAGRPADEVQRYPDPTKISMPSDAAWYTATFANPSLPAGTWGWAYFEGVKYKADDPKLTIGGAVCAAARLGAGRAFFDDLVLNEYDANGRLVRAIAQLSMDSPDGWYFWSKANTGTLTLTNAGRTDKALTISGTTDDANTGNFTTKFTVQPGYSYQINGWMRGENIPASAGVQLRIDFETSSQPIVARGKAQLRQAMQFYADWGRKNNVPIYLGEYGAGVPCFRDGRGGLQWVEDMIDLNRELGFHSTYHVYHEDNFGLFYGYNALPDPANANTPLMDLFRRKLGR
ncbi:glycoside hydrolase family 5 protein [Fibrella arboris]|uniref:glycoside hydrolase family 5 protein n=1 Tax=Fibrella arboris TaxID=3242486 RepID=UPI0035213F8A